LRCVVAKARQAGVTAACAGSLLLPLIEACLGVVLQIETILSVWL
jgi:hypothetical protein